MRDSRRGVDQSERTGANDRDWTRTSELRWLIQQLRPLLRSHLASVLLMVLSSLMFLLDPLLIKWLIDTAFPQKNLHLLFVAAAGFLAVYGCRTALSAISRFL